MNNDPTVERCQKRAIAMGSGGIFVANIFALRSTDPQLLYSHPDPVGPNNDSTIQGILTRGESVICGWGTHGSLHDRGRDVLQLIRAQGKTPLCLGVTNDGMPRHPLYIGYNVAPVPL